VKRIFAAAVFIVSASPLFAGSLVTTSSCTSSRYYGHHSCLTTKTYVSDPIPDYAQQRRDAIDRDKEEAKWEAFCKPTFKTDLYGVRRATYAMNGCEFGRND
jgi:hypothetical protein